MYEPAQQHQTNKKFQQVKTEMSEEKLVITATKLTIETFYSQSFMTAIGLFLDMGADYR